MAASNVRVLVGRQLLLLERFLPFALCATSRMAASTRGGGAGPGGTEGRVAPPHRARGQRKEKAPKARTRFGLQASPAGSPKSRPAITDPPLSPNTRFELQASSPTGDRAVGRVRGRARCAPDRGRLFRPYFGRLVLLPDGGNALAGTAWQQGRSRAPDAAHRPARLSLFRPALRPRAARADRLAAGPGVRHRARLGSVAKSPNRARQS